MSEQYREQYDDNQRLVFQNGGTANMTLKKSWDFYVAIGHALMIGSKLCAIRSGQTARWPYPKGSLYNTMFGNWLKEGGGHELSDWVKEYASSPENKKKESLRTRLMECMRNLPAINAWRDTLSDTDREFNLNNPTKVLAAWREYERKKNAGGAPKEKEKKETLADANNRLVEKVDAQEAKIKTLDECRIIEKPSSDKAMREAAAKLLKANPGLMGLAATPWTAFLNVLSGVRTSMSIKEANAKDEDD